jgi:hypothetical protein
VKRFRRRIKNYERKDARFRQRWLSLVSLGVKIFPRVAALVMASASIVNADHVDDVTATSG